MKLHFHLNRRACGYLHRVTAGLALAVWLLVSVAEICPPLHAWLHGGAIPDGDDCAVVAVALGHFHSPVAEIPTVEPIVLPQVIPPSKISILLPVAKILPNDRAPPVSAIS